MITGVPGLTELLRLPGVIEGGGVGSPVTVGGTRCRRGLLALSAGAGVGETPPPGRGRSANPGRPRSPLFYDSTVKSPAAVASTVCALALAGVAGAGAAQAGPPPPCSFALSAPQVTQASSASMVTATTEWTGCGPSAGPYTSVACLQGPDAVIHCAQGRGEESARVFVEYRPGSSYTATGRGCSAWAGQPPAPDCQLLGPRTATL